MDLGILQVKYSHLRTHLHECPLAPYCAFPTQVVGGFVQKAPKYTHYWHLKVLSRVKNLLGSKMTKKAQLVPASHEGP